MPDIDTSPAALREWHLGSMNDGLFIIDAPPRPSTDDIVHDREDGPTMILNVTDLPEAKAQAVVNAHNAAIHALAAKKEAVSAPPTPASDGWTKWEGGECPVAPETLVSVRYRHSLCDAGGVARNFHWRQFGGPNDIVAYRIIKGADHA